MKKFDWGRVIAIIAVLSLSFGQPAAVFAADAVGDSTGAPADTGAPGCTGSGCGQGADQGTGQGGSSAADLGADENGNLPDGVEDTRQGAGQGEAQGSGNGIAGANTNTGAGSDNSVDVDTDSSTNVNVDNNADNSTDVDATGNTGANTNNANTGNGTTTSGDANIGVTQLVNDNTVVIGGTAGLDTWGHDGNFLGDLILGFSSGTADLSGADSSIRAINDTTGADSNNEVNIKTRTEEINEIQNDGIINNILDLAAITGDNAANKNTGDGSITTGDANVAATLVNLLNTTVVNGDLWVTVADIFGDLEGNIHIPNFAGFLSAAARSSLAIDASNETTGESSDNVIDIDITDTEITTINNEADISTVVNAEAITGQNEAIANTGGADITTGDANISASSVSIANMTIEGGNWGLVVVNALNGWLGFLVGDNGHVQALSQEETVREIEAHNGNTGSDSDNHLTIDIEDERLTNIENNAVINNEINATAITGRNEANKNTGQGQINTGDANIQATAVNIANTTVKDGSLFVAVVNVFGDWFGDLFYDGNSLTQAAAGSNNTIDINAVNQETGANSNNEIDIDIDRTQETEINNEADIETILNATVDTGNNRANRNTLGAAIATGDGLLELHSRAVANLTGIAGHSGLDITINGLNDTTGFNSENKIRARINDERVVVVNNLANVSTLLGSLGMPALVNTGYNTANMNTLGAIITTGDANAEVIIQNMVNQVIAALVGGGMGSLAEAGIDGDVSIDANFINRLTGVLSVNLNNIDVNYSTDLAILNDAIIDNIINLLLNTGHNKANKNTGGGDILTGAGCFSGSIENTANQVSASGWTDVDLDNDADLINDASIVANTGHNQTNQNTAGGMGGQGQGGDCNKLAQAPVEPEIPGDEGGTNEGADGGDGGDGGEAGEEVVEEAADNKVAGIAAVVAKPSLMSSGQILKRFPVAGGEGTARLWQGTRRIPWQYLLLLVGAMAGLAWRFDRLAQNMRVASLTSLGRA